MAADGGCEMDVVHRTKEGIKHGERCKVYLSNIGLGINVKIICMKE